MAMQRQNRFTPTELNLLIAISRAPNSLKGDERFLCHCRENLEIVTDFD